MRAGRYVKNSRGDALDEVIGREEVREGDEQVIREQEVA